MEHEHTLDAIKKRMTGERHSNYLRDWVYGGIDGAVTTFAIVTGVMGAQLSSSVIIILGFANIIADGFSMAASNYLGTKAEHDELEHYAAIEKRHIDIIPEGEKQEVREIFSQKGFQGQDLERAVEIITSNRDMWIRTMLSEAYGLPLKIRSPIYAAISTFVAFLICGFAPLLPFVFHFDSPFLIASIITCGVFFSIGSVKSLWSVHDGWSAATRTLFIGVIAAILAYTIGLVLKPFANGSI